MADPPRSCPESTETPCLSGSLASAAVCHSKHWQPVTVPCAISKVFPGLVR